MSGSSLEGDPLASLDPIAPSCSVGSQGPPYSRACEPQASSFSGSFGLNWFWAGMGAQSVPWTLRGRVAWLLASSCHPERPRLDASVSFCWEVCPLPEEREAPLTFLKSRTESVTRRVGAGTKELN